MAARSGFDGTEASRQGTCLVIFCFVYRVDDYGCDLRMGQLPTIRISLEANKLMLQQNAR